MTDKSFVASQLENAAAIYQQRYELYGDNYKRFGPIMAAMFPDGLTLKTADDFGRFGLFVQVMSKTTRYGNMFTAGGHVDSLDDISVYAQMLQEVDHESAEKATQVVAQKALDINWAAVQEQAPENGAQDNFPVVEEPPGNQAEIADEAPSSAPPEVLK